MASVLKVNEIQHTGGTSALTVDSNGTIQMPQKPAWRISLASAQSGTTAGGAPEVVLWDKTSNENCFIQGDLTYNSSTGLLEVGVGGIYQINSNIRVDSVGTGYLVMRILINGISTGSSETYSIEGAPSADYQTMTATDTFKLSASDNIRISVYSSTDTSWSVSSSSTFSGFLVG